MRIITFFCLLALVFRVNAQYVEPENESAPLLKNQIGAVINPLVAVALGSGMSGLHYGLQYKRLVDDHRRLRFGLMYQSVSPNGIDHGDPVASTDSTVLFINKLSSYDLGEFRIGMEWSDYKAKHDAIYGLDLVVGYEVSRDEKHSRLVGYNYSPESLIPGNEVLDDRLLSVYEQRSLVIGIAPLLGYRVRMKEKWELMACASPEIAYFAPISESGQRDPGTERMANSILFRIRLLDVSLAYSF